MTAQSYTTRALLLVFALLITCGIVIGGIVGKTYVENQYLGLGDARRAMLRSEGYERVRHCGDDLRAGVDDDKSHAASVGANYIACVEGTVASVERELR
jgi:hypothetical protein